MIYASLLGSMAARAGDGGQGLLPGLKIDRFVATIFVELSLDRTKRSVREVFMLEQG